jgi:cytochrome c oxidase subunit 3
MQWMGFRELWAQGITLVGNVAYSFLFVIVGFHALHVLGGVIALLVLYIKVLTGNADRSNMVPVQLVATYWHFVDLLWIYLMIFLLMIR